MMELDKNSAQQLPLEFGTQNYMGREDFMVSDCNRIAFEMLDSWPNWLSSGLFIYGPKGCGKSHLAHLFVDKLRTSTGKPMKIAVVSAEQVRANNVKRLAEENQSIVIENVRPRHNDESLFHLFNLFNEEGKYMLWTAEKPANQLHFALPDLQTRLNMLPSAAIAEPDDVMLQMLIVKLFNDRQIIICPDILNYIINNAQRSFDYMRELVKEIDEVSLALQSAVNYNVVKTAIGHLEFKKNGQPDLFDDY